MAKYLITWESDMSRVSTDPKEQAAMRMKMLEMTKQNLKEGKVLDWGVFLGGFKGYAIGKGSATEMAIGMAQFAPYVTFKVQEVLSVDEMSEAMKSLMG
jgi:hypothetical protein